MSRAPATTVASSDKPRMRASTRSEPSSIRIAIAGTVEITPEIEPASSGRGVGAVRFGMHQRSPVAFPILARDHVPAEQLAQCARAAVTADQSLIPFVIIEAKYCPARRLSRHETIIKFVGDAVFA